MPPPAPQDQLPAPTDARDRLLALVARAQDGDTTALPAIRRLLDHPTFAAAVTGLASRVRDGLLTLIAGHDLLLREIATREADRLSAELLGPTPTPVERLLAERVAVGWLQVQEADLRLATARLTPRAEFFQRRADHAHRRFLAAVRALTAVRKLARPALQVNIAEQQVNVNA